MFRKELYPAVTAFAQGVLARDSGHEVYWEQSGNPDGQPVLFLHGGPGAGCSASHRRFFDPDHYRAILLDQRGCGRSTPTGSLENNTTDALIGDLEALRAHLGIESWIVFGGSWGSTLSLAYAQRHPDRVDGLVLRGIFLGTDAEIHWFMHHMGAFFPREYDRFRDHVPKDRQADLLGEYYKLLCDEDPAIHGPAADIWAKFEAQCSTLLPNKDVVSELDNRHAALTLARLEAHYFVNRMFLEEGQLLRDADRLAGIPGVIVQGRYDVICPPRAAYDLNLAWPDSELIMVPDAGHSATEPGIAAALVSTMEQFKDLI